MHYRRDFMGNLLITWHGHSCFTVSYHNYSIVLDPYAPGSVPGLAPLSLTANRVLCSHEHSDHGFTEAVSVKEPQGPNPFNIMKIDTYHDDAQGALRELTGSIFWRPETSGLPTWETLDASSQTSRWTS